MYRLPVGRKPADLILIPSGVEAAEFGEAGMERAQ